MWPRALCRIVLLWAPRYTLHKASKHGTDVAEDLVIDASCEAVPRERGETGACAFDVRPFDDPEAGDLRSHCGTCPEILNRFVLHRHFPALLSVVRARVHALAQQHDDIRPRPRASSISTRVSTENGSCVQPRQLWKPK